MESTKIQRKTFMVFVDLDPMESNQPGFITEAEGFWLVNSIFSAKVEKLFPNIAIYHNSLYRGYGKARRRRGTYLITLDLNPHISKYGTARGAMEELSKVLKETIPHRKPRVCVAQSIYQPKVEIFRPNYAFVSF